MGTFVALLRGINVGGKNRLLMKDLVAIFERAGCTHVRSYIQSGNVVFDASPELARGIGALVSAKISASFGLGVPVLVRTARELQTVASHNPFLGTGVSVESLHVVFLADDPGKSRAAALDPDRSPPDTFVTRGREIYLACPNGMGKTKLTSAWFDAKLETISSARNWKTVLELVAMCGEPKAPARRA
jgi:uncharacterized protein (DUF1697 family)